MSSSLRPLSKLLPRWWSTQPLKDTNISVYRFFVTSNDSEVRIRKNIQLPPDIFNVPIRKDLIYTAYWQHRKALAGYSTQTQLYKWEWPGSNKKARPQLNKGLPKMGRRKAPGRFDGSFARPVRPKDFYPKHISRRVHAKALISMLTAKLAEGGLHIVDDLKVDTHKTKNVRTLIRNIVGDSCNSLLIVDNGDGTDITQEFQWGCANIPQISRLPALRVNVYELIRKKSVIFTESALNTVIGHLRKLETEYAEKFATPDRKPAPVPAMVPGWNAEWLRKRHAVTCFRHIGLR
jgi:large subunit ribosomal protein L4